MGTAISPADSFGTLEVPEDSPKQHTIVCPTASSTLTSAHDHLLAVAPGAFLPPEAFKALIENVQASAPHVRLWGGILNIDYGAMISSSKIPGATPQQIGQALEEADVYGQLLRQLVDQAIAEGFVPQKEGWVRTANVTMLCQSVGGIGFPGVSAKTAAATIMLATLPLAEAYTEHKVVSLEAWPRPLMVLLGEVDGQLRWPFASSYIAESAVIASKNGPSFAAVEKPVLVVPGVNHGNTSNGVPRWMRGDITTGVSELDTCVQALGARIAAFLSAHFAVQETARMEAREFMLDTLRQSMCLTAPYCVAAGLGDPAVPFSEGERVNPIYGHPIAGSNLHGGLISGAQRSASQAISNALAPGQVIAAEAHAVKTQQLVLAALPADQMSRLRVVATAHTSTETMLYSAPEMTPLGDGGWLLRVHVLLHFRVFDSDAPKMPHLLPAAPDYVMKLKSAHFVAAMMELVNPAQYSSLRPVEINAMALQHALAAAPPSVADRYRQLGRQLEFGDDVDHLEPKPGEKGPRTPESFIRTSNIIFRCPPSAVAPTAPAMPGGGMPSPPSNGLPAGPGTTGLNPPTNGGSTLPMMFAAPPPAAPPASLGAVRVSSPYMLLPTPDDVAALPLNQARFVGAYYVKVLSVAQAMEWVWLDCLRHIDTPW